MRRPEILDKAKECVCGQRQQDYGTPEDNFRRIAGLWNVYLSDALNLDVEIGPVDVANMMVLLKVARISSGHATDDSFVDIAGYAACGGEIASRLADEITAK